MSKGKGSNIEVTKADQDNINAFNRLNTRYHQLQVEVKAKESQLADFEDASNELMLADEEMVRYSVGECFFAAQPDEAEERLQAATEDSNKELEALKEELQGVQEQMGTLKQTLYDRLGNSINLEED
jgi:prefoldin subunit 4